MTVAGTVSTAKAPVAVSHVAKAAPAGKMNVIGATASASKLSLAVPPPLIRTGTVTPPEQRSPSGRRPDAALPAWPPGVRVAVEAPVPKVSSSDDEASPRAASAARLPPTPGVEKRELLAAVASPGAVYRTPELLYEPVKASQLDAVRILDENPNRAAWLLLSLKPPRKALPAQAPAPPRRAPKASSAPRPFAPSRFRRNHQAMSKPPQDADGNYPCAHKCGRVFGHAPAAVAHSKACKHKPPGWQPIFL